MLRSEPSLIFSTLHPPRPLAPEALDAALTRLAADRAAPLLVFEARAEHGQHVRFLIGTPVEHVRWLQRTLRDLLPGLELEGHASSGDVRQPIERAVRLRVRPRALALATDRPEHVTLSLLSALDAHLAHRERLVLQILLGPRLSPRHLPPDTPDPTAPWWQLLASGQAVAPKPVRDQIQTRQGHHGFAATMRIGVRASTPERRQQLIVGVLGALSTAQDRGTYFDLTFEAADKLNRAVPPWHYPLRLATSELTGLLAWPLGERDLPGVPPLHPKPLRVPDSVPRKNRVFATSAGADSSRPVGIAASDLISHFIATGPTGSGKTTALLHLIAADAAAGRPVILLDPKRQLVDDVIERAIPRERMDVVIIDPAEARGGRVVGFNPLDIGARDPDVVVDGLVAVLSAVFHDGWGPRTQDIIHSALSTLARVGRHRQRSGQTAPFTMLDLPRLLTDEQFRRSVIGVVADDPGLGSFWGWYNGLTPQAQAQAIAAPLNKLRQYLLRPALRAILGQAQPAFRLRDLFRDNKIVLVALNEGLIGPLTAQLLGSLIVAEVWSATLERANERHPERRPASVVIDEVQQYLHLPTSIDDALARSRSLGVGWHLAHQFRAQLPSSTRAAIDSNAKSKLVFRPSDPDDARDMARHVPELEAIDFLSLGQYQAYATLSVDGAPSRWSLVSTLPPPALSGLGDEIRRVSHHRYARATAAPATDPTSQTDAASSQYPTGRKRRSS